MERKTHLQVTYSKSNDFTDSSLSRALSGNIHQIVLLRDSAEIDAIKWPIFITDTPEQRKIWCSRISPRGNFAFGTSGYVPGMAHRPIELVTQVFRHEKWATVWAYIVGTEATTEVPPIRNPYACPHKCGQKNAAGFKNMSSLQTHLSRCHQPRSH